MVVTQAKCRRSINTGTDCPALLGGLFRRHSRRYSTAEGLNHYFVTFPAQMKRFTALIEAPCGADGLGG
ncbi:hypothetical protein KCP75_12485 [Salmonella enterica subsp. enterica]|nr:hypothetical protein KCP75_12485 [Salmonella enterica subsp. enterica]